MKKLNPKQEAFCKEYLIDNNAAAAAIRVGYSKRTAGEMGYENLNKPHIKARIAELRAIQADKFELRLEDVLKRVMATAIDGEQENNRLKAEDMLMKHLGAYTEKIEVSGQMDVVQYYAPKKDKSK